MNPIELSVFASRIEAVCDEMGAVLRRASFSPNIRDRFDFSCAVFDVDGELCAQAAHIPVHLGSMAYAMRSIVEKIDWQPGDMVILNDPFLGGTHLPDVSLIAPFFVDINLLGFVVNRAHHADIGSETPGSMPLSRSLEEEGLIIPPSCLVRKGVVDEAFLNSIINATRNPREARGDFAAQISANHVGITRLSELVSGLGANRYQHALAELNDYAERLARNELKKIPDGEYHFADQMDDDGLGHTDIPIKACVQVKGQDIHVDFTGTAEQVEGNINCPLSVAAAAVYYVFRCLMPDRTPACAGSFRPVTLSAPEGCFLNASRPAAVAAGNVETSTRVVDVLLGALAQAIPEQIPAASHGSMNNLAMGSVDPSHPWDYYETIGGGMGGGPQHAGISGVQTHMTNTLNTPIEVLEMRFPIRILKYCIRKGSGGAGKQRGGDGLIREFKFLQSGQATLLTDRRQHAPWGLKQGEPGKTGVNLLNDKWLPGKVSLELQAGDILTIKTPGGGGFGAIDH